MRNLKKILALVLALVMSLSLMATAGAASFPDVDAENPYATAIEVLDGLKVFQGFEDGTFKPTDSLNRAQAAVLVYRIATGDVDNKYVDNYTYMQQSKFNDLDGYNWAKGYINYCQNAGIVVGTSATTFNPGAPVTGYQLMVMLLRTLGYGKAGEFTDPKGWELQTSTIAEREGLLKNVVSGDFGAPAQRQMVAEILFRGLLHETVEYSPLTPNGYTNSGVTLGSRVGLEEITGVVTANQIADLGGSKPLAEGRTNLDVEGKTYKLNLATTAEEIGTSIHAYIKGSDVLAREDAGTDIKDNEGAKSKVKDLADGLRLNDETEYYVNYDPVLKDTSDWRLEYVVVLPDPMTEKEAAELVKANGGVAFIAQDTTNPLEYVAATDSASRIDKDNVDSILSGSPDDTTDETYTYDKVIPVEQIITSKDHSYIKDIFYGSDSFNDDAVQGDDIMTGEVYVATRSGKSSSVDKSYDISDELSYKEFYEKYIDDDENRSFDAADRGEWLRVIDNDGDGNAEYVLRVDFVMTTITDYDKRTDTYTVEYDKDEKAGTANDTAIKAGDIAKMSEDTDLSVGAVVLYTLIDGVYHVCNPQVDTYAIEKKSIDIKTENFTANGTEYTWSGIDKEAAEYYKELVELDEEVTYDLYLDHFGFVRLATEASKGLILLTDGYFKTNYRESEYKATAWTGSALEDIDVADKGTWKLSGTTYDGFIDTFEDDHDGNRGTWLRLNGFGEYYYNDRTRVDSNGNGNTGHQNDYDGTYDQYHYVDRDDADTTTANTHKYGDPFYTNIAAYTAEDGVYSLYDVRDTNILTNRRTYNAYEIAGTEEGYADGNVKAESVKAKNRTLYGIVDWDLGNTIDADDLTRVQTTADTVYYFVADAKDAKKLAVTSWTGYENVPEELGNFVAKRAYMVTHEISDTSDYEIADVVVFEGAKGEINNDAWLIVSAINTKRERALGKDEDGSYGETSTNLEVFDQGQTLSWDNSSAVDHLQAGQAAFYDADGNVITSNFAKYGVYAAEVVTAPGTRNRNYCEIRIDADEKYFTGFYTSEINAYELNQDTDEGDHASRNLASRDAGRIELGDDLIVMCDKDMNVLMAVNVSRSGKDGERDGSIQKLNDLHAYIEVDQDAQKVWDITEVSFVDGNDDAITDKDIDLKVKSIAKDADSFVPALTGEDAGEYQITDIDIVDGTAEVLYQADGTPILKGVESDLTLKVTLSAAAYTVTYGANKPSASTYTVKANNADVVEGSTIDYGTELTITAVNASDTNKVIVKVNGEDFWFTTTANDTKTLTVTENVTIEVTTETVSDTAKATGIEVSEGTAISFVEATTDYTVNDITTNTADITVTVEGDGASYKIYKGAANEANLLASGEGVAVGETGKAITYTIQIIAQSGAVEATYTVKLSKSAPSDNTDIKATDSATGIITTVGTTASSEKITIAAAEENNITAGQLKGYLTFDGDAGESIIVVTATGKTDAVADTELVTATHCVLVTAADGTTTAEYEIEFA